MGELCVSKVSTYWGTGPPQGSQRRSRLRTLFLLPSQYVYNWTPVTDNGVRDLHRWVTPFVSGAKTIVDSLRNVDCPLYVVQNSIASLIRWKGGVSHLHRCLTSYESGVETIVDSLYNISFPVYFVQHYLLMLQKLSPYHPSDPTNGALHVSGGGEPLATIAPLWCWWTADECVR